MVRYAQDVSDLSPYRLAEKYFDDHLYRRFAGEVPRDTIRHLRMIFVTDAMSDPSLMGAVRDTYGLPLLPEDPDAGEHEACDVCGNPRLIDDGFGEQSAGHAACDAAQRVDDEGHDLPPVPGADAVLDEGE